MKYEDFEDVKYELTVLMLSVLHDTSQKDAATCRYELAVIEKLLRESTKFFFLKNVAIQLKNVTDKFKREFTSVLALAPVEFLPSMDDMHGDAEDFEDTNYRLDRLLKAYASFDSALRVLA